MTRLALAFTAGIVASTNPCSIAMLPTYLSYFLLPSSDRSRAPGPSGSLLEGEEMHHSCGVQCQTSLSKSAALQSGISPLRRAVKGVQVGVATALGFSLVYGVGAVFASLGLKILATLLPWISILIAGALLFIGSLGLFGKPVGIVASFVPEAKYGFSGRVLGFGAAYGLASLSCSLGPFTALVANSLIRSGIGAVIGSFVSFSLGATTLFLAVALSAGAGSGAISRRIKRASGAMTPVAGFIQVTTAALIAWYWLPRLLGVGEGSPVLARISGVVSAALTQPLFLIGIALSAVFGVGLLVFVRSRAGTDTEATVDPEHQLDPEPGS